MPQSHDELREAEARAFQHNVTDGIARRIRRMLVAELQDYNGGNEPQSGFELQPDGSMFVLFHMDSNPWKIDIHIHVEAEVR